MTRSIRKALADIRSNRFLNLITIVTIALSILVVSVFLLFFENASRVLESWNQGGRAMVYMDKGFTPDMLPRLKTQIAGLGPVEQMNFIPRDTALKRLQSEMGAKTRFFEGLAQNPLPHAVEISIAGLSSFEQLAALAAGIEALDLVESVEYGQGWLGRFLKLFNLFRMTGYAMCSLFLLIALFITANTVRLAFYARRTEIEIMRLVGATESFIKTPFYVEGLLQGFFGGLLGVAILLAGFMTLSTGITRNIGSYVYMDIRFLSWQAMGVILFSSTFLGWFGCYLSLKQILR